MWLVCDCWPRQHSTLAPAVASTPEHLVHHPWALRMTESLMHLDEATPAGYYGDHDCNVQCEILGTNPNQIGTRARLGATIARPTPFISAREIGLEAPVMQS